MVENEAPAYGESRRQTEIPSTYGHRATSRLYPTTYRLAVCTCICCVSCQLAGSKYFEYAFTGSSAQALQLQAPTTIRHGGW